MWVATQGIAPLAMGPMVRYIYILRQCIERLLRPLHRNIVTALTD